MNEGAAVSTQERTRMVKARLNLMIKSKSKNSPTYVLLQRELEMPFVPYPGLYIKSGNLNFKVDWVEWDALQDWLNVWLDNFYIEDLTIVNETVKYLRGLGWF